MKIELSPYQKEKLQSDHKRTHDSRVADRIKAVLLSDEGWSESQIAHALRITPETVGDHLMNFQSSQRALSGNGVTQGRHSLDLTAEQELSL